MRRALIAALVTLLAVAFAIWRLFPPVNDIGDGFEAARALAHLRQFARESRSLGSPANLAAREYIAFQFRELGMDVRVADGKVRALTVHNIVARLRGSTYHDGAVMLSAHYDSVRAGPGASDDGAAVAALLEVARVLTSEPPPKRDVIFLITDGEEVGLLGAKAFVRDHPWRKDVGIVLNFEARGTSGPSTMFETSRDNRWMIEQFALVAPHPVATSLEAEIYRRMPNGTDMIVFLADQMPGMNFAFIGSYHNYHTSSDDLDHLSTRSMRHHGVQALALARHLANLDELQPKSGDDAVYFDLWSFFVVRYPAWLATPLALIASALGAVPCVRSIRARRVSIRGMLAGFGLMLASIAICSGLVFGIVRWTHLRSFDVGYAGAVMLEIVIAALACRILTHRVHIASIAFGSLIFWMMLALGTALLLPTASYVFVAPLLLMSIAAWINAANGWQFLLATFLCAAAAGINAGHLYLGGLGLTLGGLHLILCLVGLIVWLVLPVLWQAAHRTPAADIGTGSPP